MVRPKELIEGVIYHLQQNASLPDETKFVGYEPDIESEPIKLPLIEVTPGVKLEVSDSNSDLVGYQTNDKGERIGRIFDLLYEMEITVAAWTAHESRFSPREIADSVQDALYDLTTGGPDRTIEHPEIGQLDEVWYVDISQGEQTDNLTTSPTLRRWEQIITFSASEEYVTVADEPPVEDFEESVTG